jgi:hypothetical protein
MYPDALNSNFGAWAYPGAASASMRSPAKHRPMNFFISPSSFCDSCFVISECINKIHNQLHLSEVFISFPGIATNFQKSSLYNNKEDLICQEKK